MKHQVLMDYRKTLLHVSNVHYNRDYYRQFTGHNNKQVPAENYRAGDRL